MSSKPRFPISGMNRSFLAAQTPARAPAATPTSTPPTPTSTPTSTPIEAAAPTSLARRAIAISGAGRRLGISGMRRPGLETPTTTSTPDDTNEGLP